MATGTLTQEQAQAPVPKKVADALNKSGNKVKDLTPEQRAAAVIALETRPDLKGKQLAAWIMEAKPEPEPEVEPPRRGPGRPRMIDPEAEALAARAQAISGMLTPFSTNEARTFLDHFTVTVEGEWVRIERDNADPVAADQLSEVRINLEGLRTFLHDRKLLPEEARVSIHRSLVALYRGTRPELWGTKMPSLLIAKIDTDEATA